MGECRRYLGVLLALLIVPWCGCDEDPAAPNSTVVARFEVSPGIGTVFTDFEFNAGKSSATSGTLRCRWNWRGDAPRIARLVP